MVENADQFATDWRRVVCESCHCADFLKASTASRYLHGIIPKIPRFMGRGARAKKSVTPADFHEKSWYNSLEACFSPLPFNGGELFPVTVKSQQLRGGDES